MHQNQNWFWCMPILRRYGVRNTWWRNNDTREKGAIYTSYFLSLVHFITFSSLNYERAILFYRYNMFECITSKGETTKTSCMKSHEVLKSSSVKSFEVSWSLLKKLKSPFVKSFEVLEVFRSLEVLKSAVSPLITSYF